MMVLIAAISVVAGLIVPIPVKHLGLLSPALAALRRFLWRKG
jgi:hypothetical protein